MKLLPTTLLLPTSLNWDNFKQALSSIRYGQSLLNTFLITFFSNVGWILIAPMGAYYIGRIDNKFCKIFIHTNHCFYVNPISGSYDPDGGCRNYVSSD